MLGRSTLRLTAVAATCVPHNFAFSTDLAFYSPRFTPSSHVINVGIPEVTDALALLNRPKSGRWSLGLSGPSSTAVEQRKELSTAMGLLDRGIDILDSMGPTALQQPAMAASLRSLYALRFEVLSSPEHLPRVDYGRHIHVQKTILRQSGRLLYYNDAWDKTDIHQIEVSYVLLANFVRAYSSLHTISFRGDSAPVAARPSPTSPLKSLKSKSSGSSSNSSTRTADVFSLAVEGAAFPDAVLTLAVVVERVDELLRLSHNAAEEHKKLADLRWLEPKLHLLKALLTIASTGNLYLAKAQVDKAAEMVQRMTMHEKAIKNVLEPKPFETELGLFLLAQAEMNSRIFDWSGVQKGEMDAAVARSFEAAAGFYAQPLTTSLDADGIMTIKDGNDSHPFERQAYTMCLNSFADFLLNAPRPAATNPRDAPVFLPKQMFNLSPLMVIKSPTPELIFSDVEEREALPLDQCRRRTGDCLERALQLNRAMYSDHRQNAQAAWTLLSMACMYADTRDYLYATGLFESAHKCFVELFGEASMENALLLKLRYEFLAGVGSEQEAKTASHEIVHILKRLDGLPQ